MNNVISPYNIPTNQLYEYDVKKAEVYVKLDDSSYSGKGFKINDINFNQRTTIQAFVNSLGGDNVLWTLTSGEASLAKLADWNLVDESSLSSIILNPFSIIQNFLSNPMLTTVGLGLIFYPFLGTNRTIDFFKDLKKKNYDLLIIDTIGSAITKDQLEKDIEENTIGSLANRVTLFLRKAEAILKPLGVTVILLNHKKDKIGGFNQKHYTTGGRQILFSSSIRLSVTKKKANIFTEPEESIITNIWINKNKVINKPTVSNCMYTIIRGKGISRGEECFRLALDTGMITIKGQMFHIGKKSFRGKRNIVEFLDEHKEIRDKINEKWIEANTD